jgi:hypothetical protein
MHISSLLIWCDHCEVLKIIKLMCLLQEFKLKAHLARHYATAHGLAIRSGSPRPIMKTRTAFYLCTTPLTRISRRLWRHLLQPRHEARAPFWPINIPSVKQECKDTDINILRSIRWEHLYTSSSEKWGVVLLPVLHCGVIWLSCFEHDCCCR